MLAQLHDTQPLTIPVTNESRRVTAVAILLGLVLGLLLTLIGQYSTFVSIGVCLITLAVSFVVNSFISRYASGEPRWTLAISGQALGVLGIGFLFLTAIMG